MVLQTTMVSHTEYGLQKSDASLQEIKDTFNLIVAEQFLRDQLAKTVDVQRLMITYS